jgi:hypothetical protein
MRSIDGFLTLCRAWFTGAGRLDQTALEDPGHLDASVLRRVANTFVDGFSIATELETSLLDREIEIIAPSERGVGYEGVAAGKAVLDLSQGLVDKYSSSHERSGSSSSERRLPAAANLLSAAPQYSFLLYLGIGEAMAQLKLPPVLCNDFAGELWGGQIIEGYGFFDGYFNWFETLVHQNYPVGLEPSLAAAYNQGLGRALYFIHNCNPSKIREHINSFAPSRRPELWAGVGIPTAYVGGLSERELARLIDYAGTYRAELMQGVFLGSSARIKQQLVPDHTELACNVICGVKAMECYYISEELNHLLADREAYSMYQWQSAVRKVLRENACAYRK